jgi:hypothetical protein
MPPGSIGSSTAVPGDVALRVFGAFAVGRADVFRGSAVEDPKTIPWRYDSDRFPTVTEFVPRRRRRDPCASATYVAGSASWSYDRFGLFSAPLWMFQRQEPAM